MGTTWGQHEDNLKKTWDHRNVETTLGQHGDQWRRRLRGDNMETIWQQHGDHGDVETMWEHCRDNMGTT